MYKILVCKISLLSFSQLKDHDEIISLHVAKDKNVLFFASSTQLTKRHKNKSFVDILNYHRVGRLSISRDERGFPLTQYITNGEISRARYTTTHFKHHRVLRLISNRMSV